MTQREVAMERLYEEVGRCLHHAECHIPVNITTAWLNVKHQSLREDECKVCHDHIGDSTVMVSTDNQQALK